jgi:hypothetical protein
MLQWSRYTALLYAIGLGIGEAVINWGDWQFAPLWIVDYVCSAALLFAFWNTRRGGQIHTLTSAWAFTCGVFYMAFFIWLDRMREEGRSIADAGPLVGIIGCMLIFTVLGIVTSVVAQRAPKNSGKW